MIPAVAHFVWLGAELPWIYRLSIRSAALRGGFERVVLHHDRAVDLQDLRALPGFEARRVSLAEVFEGAATEPGKVAALYSELTSPASRANLLRLAILIREGGVYLDTDTVTVRSLAPLRNSGVFCGEERVVLPFQVVRSRDPRVMLRSWSLMLARDVVRRLPWGWRTFRIIENLYHRAANNAVLGAQPGHPFVRSLLDYVVNLPGRERLRRYRLGTHALQEHLSTYTGDDLVVHPPEVFYPLGPEISQHWFRIRSRSDLDAALREILGESAHVVHWYASVRTRRIVASMSAQYVHQHSDRQFFSALVRPLLSTKEA